MAKKNQDQGQDQETTEVQPVETGEETESQSAGEGEGGEGQNPLNQETAAEENRVAENGEVSDPGNSGLIGDAFTEGSVTGSADKPNG